MTPLPSTPVDANESPGRWQIIVPMAQLEISDESPIDGRWSVRDITFCSAKELSKILSEQPPLGEPLRASIIGDCESFAVFERDGTPNEIRTTSFRDLRNAADILASTAALSSRRNHRTGFAVKGYPVSSQQFDTFLATEGTLVARQWGERGLLLPFRLDEAWHTILVQTEFLQLFDLLADDTIDSDWRRQIGSAAAMLGRSVMSLDLADAFLLNVIGLETLLTERGERNGAKLANRIKGLTGWHLKNEVPDYEQRIRDIHGVRCAIVHDSDYSDLSIDKLLFGDQCLLNCLLNIVRLRSDFPTKQDVMTMADGFAENENWPEDGSLPLRWFRRTMPYISQTDLPLW